MEESRAACSLSFFDAAATAAILSGDGGFKNWLERAILLCLGGGLGNLSGDVASDVGMPERFGRDFLAGFAAVPGAAAPSAGVAPSVSLALAAPPFLEVLRGLAACFVVASASGEVLSVAPSLGGDLALGSGLSDILNNLTYKSVYLKELLFVVEYKELICKRHLFLIISGTAECRRPSWDATLTLVNNPYLVKNNWKHLKNGEKWYKNYKHYSYDCTCVYHNCKQIIQIKNIYKTSQNRFIRIDQQPINSVSQYKSNFWGTQ